MEKKIERLLSFRKEERDSLLYKGIERLLFSIQERLSSTIERIWRLISSREMGVSLLYQREERDSPSLERKREILFFIE